MAKRRFRLQTLDGPMYYGAAVEKDGRVQVMWMRPSLRLALNPRANFDILQAGFGGGQLVNFAVRAAQVVEAEE